MTTVDASTADGAVSATGGSARSQLDELEARSWAPRPFVGVVVAATAFVVPLATAVLAVQVAARLVARPRSAPWLVVWLLALVLVATVTMQTVDRASRRLLPLAAMLRLSLVFPDGAPSRFSVALKSGSGKALERSLERATTDAEFATSEQWAVLVVGLMREVSAHDRLTRGHSERVRAYADLIAEEMALDAESRSKLHWAALLHDVGKLAVPEEILNKTERLTPAEWNIIRRHPAAAERWLEPMKEWLGKWSLAATEHHERFDGDGYPRQLRGEEISLAGRIVAVADAFDVMTAARSYKTPYPAAQARAELAKNAGTQFDPQVVRALLAVSLDKLRLVMGPLASLSGFSGLFSLGGAASGAAAVVTATVVAVSALAAPVSAATPRRPVAAVEVATGSASSTSTPSQTAAGEGVGAHDSAAPVGGPAAPARRVDGVVGAVPAVDPRTPTTNVTGTGPVPVSHEQPADPPATTPASQLPVPPPVPTPVSAPAATDPTTTPVTVHHGPVANDDVRASPAKDVMVDVLANDTDADGNLDPASLKILTFPAGSYKAIKVTKGEIRVQVEKHETATLVFTYRICDAAHVCATATVTVAFHDAQ
jgi:HD domain-containing protein/Big-like domain-containing protein